MKTALFDNWKTSLPGLGLLLVTVGHYLSTGTLNMQDVVQVMGAFGLIAAKDGA